MRFVLPLLLALVPVGALALPTGPELAAQMEARQAAVKRSVRDLTVLQTVTVTTNGVTTVNAVTAYVKGEKSRTEIVATNPAAPDNVPEAYKKVTSLIVGDGREKWSFHSIRGVQKIEERGAGLPGGGPAGLKERLAAGVRVEGEETVEGRDCWKIAYDVEGTPVTLWLDRRDFFPVRQEWQEEGIPVVQYSDAFVTTDAGVDLPSRTITEREGKQAAVALVEKVTVNGGLSDDLFDLAEIRQRAATEPAKEGTFDRLIRKVKILLGIQ